MGGQASAAIAPQAHTIGEFVGDDTTDVTGRSSQRSEDEEDDDAASTDAYASTAPVTGSLSDVGGLTQGWGSLVNSKIKSLSNRNRKSR